MEFPFIADLDGETADDRVFREEHGGGMDMDVDVDFAATF